MSLIAEVSTKFNVKRTTFHVRMQLSLSSHTSENHIILHTYLEIIFYKNVNLMIFSVLSVLFSSGP